MKEHGTGIKRNGKQIYSIELADYVIGVADSDYDRITCQMF